MSRSVEIEFKNLLTKQEFETILVAFNLTKQQFFTQTNYYFDTRNFDLKDVPSSLRLRKLPDQYELTLKIAGDRGALEINEEIKDKEVENLLSNLTLPKGEIKDELIRFGIDINDIYCFGSLTTHRKEVPYKEGILVFDHSQYLGKEDFELEYEAANWDNGMEIFNQLLDEFDIKPKKTITKIARLYEEMKKQKDGSK